MKQNDRLSSFYLIDELDSIYRKLIGRYRNQKKRNLAAFFTYFSLIVILVLYAGCWGTTNTLILPLLLSFTMLIAILFVVYMQKQDNKMYRAYGIDLETPLCFNFQKEAFRKYWKIIANDYEVELVNKGKLFNIEYDIEQLKIYLDILRNEIKDKRKQSPFTKEAVSVIGIMLPIGIEAIFRISSSFEIEFFSPDFLVVSIGVFIALFVIFQMLSSIYQIYIGSQNKKVCRLEQICKIMESILIDRVTEKGKSLSTPKATSLWQKVKNFFR